MMKKTVTWIQTHVVAVEAILIILGFGFSIVFSLTNKYQELEITLLLFIGGEFVFLIIGYLDQIMKHIKKEEWYWYEDPKDIVSRINFIKSAKKNVIVVGSTLSFLHGMRQELKQTADNVKIKLYFINPDYIKDNSGFWAIMAPEPSNAGDYDACHKVFLDDIYKHLKDINNVSFFTLDALLPITYIGIDIEEKDGQILAEHYTRGDGRDIAFFAKSGCELYDKYKEQIEWIVRNSREFS